MVLTKSDVGKYFRTLDGGLVMFDRYNSEQGLYPHRFFSLCQTASVSWWTVDTYMTDGRYTEHDDGHPQDIASYVDTEVVLAELALMGVEPPQREMIYGAT